MEKINLERTDYPDDKIVFFAMPYETKTVSDGSQQNFNELFDTVYAPAMVDLELIPERADRIFGTSQGVLEAAWRGIQRAGLVVVDFSTRSADVALEFGWAMCLHKRVVALAENIDDVPTDVRGLLRPITYSFSWSGTSKMRIELMDRVRQALSEPTSAEMTFKPLEGHAEPSRAQIVAVDPECVIVRDLRTRRYAELRKDDVDYRREIPVDMTARFKQDREIDGTIIIESDGRCRFSQRVGQRNPWPELKAGYPQGRVFTTRVVNRTPGGAFVAVAHDVNGFIPRADLQLGAEVEVVVINVDPDRQRIVLALAQQHAGPAPMTPQDAYPQQGDRGPGTVRRIEVSRGFALVELDAYPGKKGLLHYRNMSSELWSAFQAGSVTEGHRLTVQVRDVRPSLKNPAFMEFALQEVESSESDAAAVDVVEAADDFTEAAVDVVEAAADVVEAAVDVAEAAVEGEPTA
ncbi:S1 RNA-binding domain-containing protein [Streptomyces werraensis]|uniref:S1 RNA-binding domain-containing protein n=1 Tax=Streptomyces werraensis TaxID=68284 RepID=UPI0034247FED